MKAGQISGRKDINRARDIMLGVGRALYFTIWSQCNHLYQSVQYIDILLRPFRYLCNLE